MEEIKKKVKNMGNAELLNHYTAYIICINSGNCYDGCGCPYANKKDCDNEIGEFEEIYNKQPRLLEDEIIKRMRENRSK